MSFGTGSSYRIGEWLKTHGGGANPPDGDHIIHIKSMDLVATQNGKPQFKMVGNLLDLNNRQHTYYYPLWEEMLWKLFNDLLAAGAPADFDPGPPGEQWLGLMRPGFVNRVFNINLKTQGEFQNVKIIGVAHPGAQPTAPPPTEQPRPSAPAGFPGGGNTPVQVQASSAWTGMQPEGPRPTQWGGDGAGGATPAQVTDAASLFRNA